MSTWTLNISYGASQFKLEAAIEYESAQIIRIRVKGQKRSLLLETDYPLVKLSKKKIKWKLREGSFDGTDHQKNANLLMQIIEQLEYYLKGKNKEETHQSYLQKNKW